MDKLIITVAPTGSVPRKKDTPHVPVTPDEIAETAYRCEQEGAAIIHVHCRDENERPTSRFDIFRESVDKIRKRTKLVVMTSTSGIAGQTDEDRATPLQTNPEMGSLTTGTLNFVGRKPYVVAGMARMQLPMTTMAIVLGGHVRVGLEDNLYLKKGVLARNEELVARARHLAEDLQREVASPDEARAIMGLGPRR